MGAVFKAREVSSGSVVVLKTLRPQLGDDETARRRFFREGEMARGLSHPNLAAFHDLVEASGGVFYMVLELIDGANLVDLLDEGGPLPVLAALDVAAQAADGLAHLHAHGILHRDVSPENLMVTRDAAGGARVKIIDLGVAKARDAEGLTTTGIFVGKLRYGSPEQLGALPKGESLDGRSDVYALGCVLYQLLTGVPPFDAETPQGYLRAHLFTGPRSFEKSDPEGRVPEAVRDVVLRALARRREERFPDALAFAAALRDVRARTAEETARRTGRPRGEVEALATEALLGVLQRARAAADGRTHAVDERDLATAGLTGRLRDETWEHPPAPLSGDGDLPTVRLSAERRGALPPATSASGTPAGTRSVLVFLAAALVVVVAAASIAISRRSPPPAPVPPAVPAPVPTGALLLTASPWARVTSVVRESDGAAVPLGEVVTPARLVLPEGRYRVALRGEGTGPEVVLTATVGAGAQTPLHADTPGFDLEAAVRAHAP